jgi:translocation and assembly module TamB
MVRRRGRRAFLFLSGVAMGLFGMLIGLWFYLQAGQVAEVRRAVGEQLRLSRDAIERVDFVGQNALRISLRDVALLDERGDTVLAAPRLRMTLDARTLEGEGPIELFDVEVLEPFARLILRPDGEWNYLQALNLTAAGEQVDVDPGRPVIFRDVRLVDGRMIIALPSETGPQPPDARFVANLPLERMFDRWYQVYNVSDVQARLPRVRIGGPDGWRADVASLTARIQEPDIRVTQFTGWAEQVAPDGVRFDIATLRFGDSALAGTGLVRFLPAGPLYDVEISADRLLLADLQPIFPTMPAEGFARFDVAVRSQTADRVALAFTNLDFQALDSRILGRVAFAAGGDRPFSLMDADLELAPLRLLTLEQLGLTEELPVLGQLSGRVSAVDAAAGLAAVDLAATLFPRGSPDGPISSVFLTGNVGLGDGTEPVTFAGLTVSLQPLNLATMREVAPEQADLLRGQLRGGVTLTGTTTRIGFAAGDLTYQVGDAPPTRLAALEGEVTLQPELAYTASLLAQPLAFQTLTELFPAIPLAETALTGPITISGDARAMQFTANLTGAAGGIRIGGDVAFGDPPRFDVQGSLSAFVPGILLTPEVPIDGPLTGVFAIRGTTREFAFDVDLTQVEGRFALRGTVAPGVDPPRFDVAGELFQFRLGGLIGQPALFPDPMTGPIAVAGGGGAPYTFDVDLRGAIGQFTLAGFYDPAPVPAYRAVGRVAGLDVSRWPTGIQFPTTAITADIELQGRGTTLEGLQGYLVMDGAGSTIADLPLDVAVARVEVSGGVLAVDTLHLEFAGTRLVAAGGWGLTRPAPVPLRYSLNAPDLSALRRIVAPGELIPPQLTGSIQAQGEIAGTLDHPIVTTALQATNLRYEDWRAGALTLSLSAERDPAVGISGQLTLDGRNLNLGQFETLESLRLEASGTEGAVAVGVLARRDARSDLAFSGLLELEGFVPEGIALETLTIRVDPVVWELLQPTRLRWTDEEGLAVQNLVLARRAPQEGIIVVDGVLPPTGPADLTVRAENVDLADLRRITGAGPALEGVVSLEAIVAGPVADPEVSIQATAFGVRYEGVLTELIAFEGLYSGQRLTGSAEATAEGRPLFRADLSVPMVLSLEQLVPSFELLDAAPVSMVLVADSLPLDLIAAAVPGLANGTGIARAEIQVGGTLDVPALQGWARLDGGAVTIEPLNVRYSGMQADVTLVGNRVLVNSFSARSVGGLSASGTIDFLPGTPPSFALSTTFDNFRFIDDPAVARLTASGQLSLTGTTAAPLLTGGIQVRESVIRVPDMAQSQPGLDLAYADVDAVTPFPGDEMIVAAPPLGNINIDGLELSFAESVWLESNEVRVQIAGDLIVYSFADDLRIFGALQAVRGTYALEISAIVREFDVIRGRVQFFGTGDLNPSLDILAGYRVRGSTVGRGGDITILVQVSGTLLAPRVTLTSDTPVPLSEADLISYLLFGQPSFELGGVTRTFAEQLLVQEVFGGILAAELERPILRAGLCDWVRVRPGVVTTFRGLFGTGPLAGAAIECGWELAPDLFLTGQTGIGGLFGGEFTDWRLGLEWQIDDQWLWEGSYGAVQRDQILRMLDPVRRYQFSTDLRRRWEYGRPQRQPIIDLLGPPDDREEPPPTIPGGVPLSENTPAREERGDSSTVASGS